MAQQQQQGGGGGDSAYGPIWIVVGLFIVGWLTWTYAKSYIVSVLFAINIVEANIVSLFTDSLNNDIYMMKTVDPSAVTWEQLSAVTAKIGNYFRYPITLILIFCASLLYFSDVTRKFRRTHSMNSLRKQEQNNWTQIAPVINLDLVDQDINKGPWAMALSPMEFARKHKLLRYDEFAPQDPKRPGIPITAGIRRAEAKAAFVLQLGNYWRGYEHLPPHLLALCAVFAARVNQDRDGAATLLREIDQSIMKGGIKFTGAKALLTKHANQRSIQECAAKHAYVFTFMPSLLLLAREDGVLATADFLWLKTVDRRAWYVLNSVGRQTPYTEVAGIFAHWKAEKALGRKSMVPMVEESIRALEDEIKTIKLSPEELGALEP